MVCPLGLDGLDGMDIGFQGRNMEHEHITSVPPIAANLECAFSKPQRTPSSV